MGSSAIVNKLKNFIGFGDEFEDYEDEIEEVEVNEVEESAAGKSSFRKQKVVPINGYSSQTKIVVLKPSCFNATWLLLLSATWINLYTFVNLN